MNSEEEVIHTVQSMTERFHCRDLAGVMSHYAEPSTIVFEPGSPVTDPAQQRAGFQQFFAISPRFEYTAGHEVFVAGDSALHIAPWRMRGQTPDGEKVEQSGLSVAVLRRQGDGRWRLVLDDPHGAYLLSTLRPVTVTVTG